MASDCCRNSTQVQKIYEKKKRNNTHSLKKKLIFLKSIKYKEKKHLKRLNTPGKRVILLRVKASSPFKTEHSFAGPTLLHISFPHGCKSMKNPNPIVW